MIDFIPNTRLTQTDLFGPFPRNDKLLQITRPQHHLLEKLFAQRLWRRFLSLQNITLFEAIKTNIKFQQFLTVIIIIISGKIFLLTTFIKVCKISSFTKNPLGHVPSKAWKLPYELKIKSAKLIFVKTLKRKIYLFQCFNCGQVLPF